MSADLFEQDAFEADIAARMGAATETVGAEGVTREGIDERLAARRSARRRRQGGIALAAAALVVVAGIGAVVATGGEPQTSVQADQGGTTEAPTTAEAPPTTECDTADQPGEVQTGPCPAPPPPSTDAPTTVPPQTSPVPTDAPPPPTTEAPPTTTAPVTEPPTTTAPARPPASPTALDFVRGVIEGRDVSALVEAGFDPVADMRSELPEDLTGFVAQPVDIFDWDSWSVSSATVHPGEPSCADVGDASVMCVVSVVRDDFATWLHVYMTGNGPTRVAAVDSDAD